MPVSSFFRKVGKTATDNLVGVASGKTNIRGLDSPKFYRSIFVLGLLALGASGWFVYHSIFQVIAVQKITPSVIANANTTTVASLTALKDKDTDGDTISDYDELYVVRTSPYLKDSDGDGLADAVETQQGSDPNCPKGKVCQGFRPLTSMTDANGDLTPEFLRRALASAGVPQTTLDSTDDASLVNFYKQALKNTTPTNTNSVSNSNTAVSNTNSDVVTNTPAITSVAEIEQLSPTAIRELLVKNGLDAATLSTVSDETLQQIFKEALTTANQ